MSTTTRAVLAGAIAVSFAAAQAQETLDFHSCTVQIGGGYTDTSGPDSHNLKSGWDFQAGGGFAATRSFAVTGNFLMAEPGVSNPPATVNINGAPVTVSGARAKFYSVSLDPELRVYARKQFNVYVLAGFGWFRRSIEYTGAGGPTLTHPGDMKLEAVSANSGAMNFGAGLNFRATRSLRLYAEARYLHGLAINRESTLIPVIFGIRW